MAYFKELKKYSVGITATNAVVSTINAAVSLANSPDNLVSNWAVVAAMIAIVLEIAVLVLVLIEMINNSLRRRRLKSRLCCFFRRFTHHDAK